MSVKVTNNHDGVLYIAGAAVRPKKTIAVDDKLFASWSTGHAAKIWIDRNIVTVEKVDSTQKFVLEEALPKKAAPEETAPGKLPWQKE